MKQAQKDKSVEKAIKSYDSYTDSYKDKMEKKIALISARRAVINMFEEIVKSKDKEARENLKIVADTGIKNINLLREEIEELQKKIISISKRRHDDKLE